MFACNEASEKFLSRVICWSDIKETINIDVRERRTSCKLQRVLIRFKERLTQGL